MNILVFSIVPLFKDYDMGGAQKHLRYIAIHLGERGHQVRILCTRRADSNSPFQWHENVHINPTLRFKQPFPGPYDTGAHNLATIVQDIADHLDWAERFYIHDGEMLFPYLTERVPTVVGLRDNVYPETIMGSFLFQADTLIVISEYSRRFVMATAGRFMPDLPQRLRVINNGIDWSHFKPTPPDEVLQRIDVDPDQHAIVLHPHRPETTKGMFQTIAATERMVKHHSIDNLRVLVPRWIGTHMDEGVKAFYEQVEADIAARNLTEHVIFHEWIPYALLPQYYSLGQVSFSLGSFVESFGNAVYESMGCGTPTVVARIATHRELMPEHLIDKVNYDDTDAAADVAAEIIRTRRKPSDEAIAYLYEHYGFQRQLATYADVIENARTADRLPFIAQPRTAQTPYQLAPWCYISNRGIYHDFRADYADLPELITLLNTYEAITPELAAAQGIDGLQFEAWYREGYVVPVGDRQ